jgi:hypothetical protein
LGVEINISKSISHSTEAFEFAKRTIWKGVDVSSISLQQIISSVSLGSRVVNAYSFMKKGLIQTVPHLSQILSNSSKSTAMRDLKAVGLPALSLLNLLVSKDLVELRIVLESLVNPRFEDFDFEKAKFDLPMLGILRQCLLPFKKEDGVLPYPFSKEEDRKEFSGDYIPHLSAVILQDALLKAKHLSNDYEELMKVGAKALSLGKGSSIFEAQKEGFFQDLVFDLSNMDPLDLVDDVEDTLYNHAKYQHITIPQSIEILDRVDAMIFKFTFKTELSHAKFDRDGSPILKLLRKSEGKILIPY